jgi:nicotinamide mononucleotide transporter
MMESLFAPAFTLWGSATTWLEIVAFVLAVAMVLCNIREKVAGWPLAILSSLLYFALFWRSKLYGEAGLQVFFVLLAAWGWGQWLLGRRADGGSLRVARLAQRNAIFSVASGGLLWVVTGLFLLAMTDSDVPWLDAFPTALSVVGTVLLGRKFIENWLVWILVNTVSVGLFAYKGLWLTVLLYLLFIALSALGYRAWHTRLQSQT